MSGYKKIDERIDLVHDYWLDPDSREMWIHGFDVSGIDYEGGEPGVEYNMATRVIKNLHYFRKQSSKADVTIHLHTCGGMVEDGMAIYDTIRLMPYPVTIINYTHARSMSSIIFQAASGDCDTRLMLPSSYFMFHFGSLCLNGIAKRVYSEVEWAKKYDDKMLDIYVDSARGSKKFMNKSDSQIRKELISHMNRKDDVFLMPEEAIEWGFADGILETWPEQSGWK